MSFVPFYLINSSAEFIQNKSQITSSKSQTNFPAYRQAGIFQIPDKTVLVIWSLEPGAYLGFGIWCLEFGVWNFTSSTFF
jgi:hypothetical protein